ncbi:bifunctional helix-turn-helix domain-containing protein/methylated-DNA--[protein]-cysteine S-methyltransferase [Methylosinus sp. Ce-a6]|uniref:methylated-DNA--[protein]-cysteine S-methyltransferase n=1 Tax=Methylosinus sp. Ce-a6 TaxID=2172005 RepID=UPI00135C9B9F|nr:bifunctional helix-turn-helix domain-containing protein/methylated-DNA--[protein]-cysteine S-methyltransferase [Methylosinus sp. Ce-a6]
MALAVQPCLPAPEPWLGDDYAAVARTIHFIGENWRRQPSVEEMARAARVSEQHLRALFRRWAGLSPKEFLEALTLRHARALLDGPCSLLDASLSLGLSGPSRLHDLFVTHESLTPGEFKRKGEGLDMRYGFHPSPFGEAILVATERGLAGLGFADGAREAALEDLRRRWPKARFSLDENATAPFARRAFDPAEWWPERPLRLVLIGSEFDVSVWEALLSIEMGRATTYGAIARRLGKPGAARAVGASVGRNPVSFVVPCHRVLGASGALTGYHWGLTRKQAIIGWEAGRIARAPSPSRSAI